MIQNESLNKLGWMNTKHGSNLWIKKFIVLEIVDPKNGQPFLDLSVPLFSSR